MDGRGSEGVVFCQRVRAGGVEAGDFGKVAGEIKPAAGESIVPYEVPRTDLNKQ